VSLDAASLVSALARSSSGAVELARCASLAARIEPELLRALRLNVLHGTEASVEADLWFSQLVRSRSASSIALQPEVALFLQRSLAEPSYAKLAARARSVIVSRHQQAPELLRKEEDLIFALVRPAEGVEIKPAEILREILDRLLADERRRTEIAAWAVRALPRLPFGESRPAAFWSLLLASNGVFRAGAADVPGTPSANAFGTLPRALFASARDIGVEGELRGSKLRLRATETPTLKIYIPNVKPLVVLVGSTPVQLRHDAWSDEVDVGTSGVALRAIDGRGYQLTPRGTAPRPEVSWPTLVEVRRSNETFALGYFVTPLLVATAGHPIVERKGGPFTVRIDGTITLPVTPAAMDPTDAGLDCSLLRLAHPFPDARLVSFGPPAEVGASCLWPNSYGRMLNVVGRVRRVPVSGPNELIWAQQEDHTDPLRPTSGGVVMGPNGIVGHIVQFNEREREVGVVPASSIRAAVERVEARVPLETLADKYADADSTKDNARREEAWLELAKAVRRHEPKIEQREMERWFSRPDKPGHLMLGLLCLSRNQEPPQERLRLVPQLAKLPMDGFTRLVALQALRALQEEVPSDRAYGLSSIGRSVLAPRSSEPQDLYQTSAALQDEIERWTGPWHPPSIEKEPRKDLALSCCEMLRALLLGVHVRGYDPVGVKSRHLRIEDLSPPGWTSAARDRVWSDCEGGITSDVQELIVPPWQELRDQVIAAGGTVPAFEGVGPFLSWSLDLLEDLFLQVRQADAVFVVDREAFAEFSSRAPPIADALAPQTYGPQQLKLKTDLTALTDALQLAIRSLNGDLRRLDDSVVRTANVPRSTVALLRFVDDLMQNNSTFGSAADLKTPLPNRALWALRSRGLSHVLKVGWVESRQEWAKTGLCRGDEPMVSFIAIMLDRARELFMSLVDVLGDWHQTNLGFALDLHDWRTISSSLHLPLRTTPVSPSEYDSTKKEEVQLSGMVRDFVRAYDTSRQVVERYLRASPTQAEPRPPPSSMAS
jgi:hypothetical protein